MAFMKIKIASAKRCCYCYLHICHTKIRIFVCRYPSSLEWSFQKFLCNRLERNRHVEMSLNKCRWASQKMDKWLNKNRICLHQFLLPAYQLYKHLVYNPNKYLQAKARALCILSRDMRVDLNFCSSNSVDLGGVCIPSHFVFCEGSCWKG